MLAQAPPRSTAALPAQPIPRLDFMPAWKIWDMLLGADPEIKLLNAQGLAIEVPGLARDRPAVA